MATKYQFELALKAVLLELQHRGVDLYDIADESLGRMERQKLFIKEDSLQERGGAENVLSDLLLEIVGKRPARNGKTPNLEDFDKDL